jgi:hypothetical protein
MTLKLIDKDLRNKYAEALYKNELSYDKEMNQHFRRLNLDMTRNSHMMDAGSQVFLNRVRQKRLKWSMDDMRFREHYKLVCRNVYNKKLDNLNTCFMNLDERVLDPFSQRRYEFLKRELRQSNVNHNSLFLEDENSQIVKSSIPKLPSVVNSNRKPYLTDELYERFNPADLEFLDKFPAKIEVTLTDVGKQYIKTERSKHITLKNQKKRFRRIQENALNDQRFKNLQSYLKEI